MKSNQLFKSDRFLSVLTVLTCLSFCASGWHYSRGAQLLVSSNMPSLTHELCAFLLGGFFSSIIFELSVRMYSIKKRPYGIASGPYNQQARSGIDALPREALQALLIRERKKIAALRLFIIGANIVAFCLSFIYFSNRIFYAWGKILLNFLVSLPFFAGFLVLEARRTEKNRIGAMIVQTGRIYLTAYCLMALAEFALSMALI